MVQLALRLACLYADVCMPKPDCAESNVGDQREPIHTDCVSKSRAGSPELRARGGYTEKSLVLTLVSGHSSQRAGGVC